MQTEAHRAATRRYLKSEKGRVAGRRAEKRYDLTGNGIARKAAYSRRYLASGKGVIVRERYKQSPKGVLARCRGNAKARGLDFALTVEDITELVAPMTCAVTGMSLQWASDETKCLLAPSLDRIDNSLGYVRGNVHCVALWVNLARNDALLKDLIAILEQLKANAAMALGP